MKRSIRIFMGTATLAGMLFAGAPAASASTAAQDCTTDFLAYVFRPPNPPALVTYTPPADVTIHGNQLVGAASALAGATKAYIDCVV